jgi:D-alanine-D-alanine ligase
MNQKKLRIGLIYGGESAEREVSIHTADQIRQFLDRKKYRVIPIELGPAGQWPKSVSLNTLAEKIDVAFIALHGPYGEDGTIQGLMEMLHIPYTFSGVLASSLAMDKIRTQYLAQGANVLTPESILVTRPEWAANQRRLLKKIKKLGRKIVMKPNQLGSSIGVRMLAANDIKAGLVAGALRKNKEIIFQPYIAGKEITAPVLGNEQPRALPLIDIISTVPQGTFYDYKAKYAPGGSEHVIPAPLPKKLYKQIQDTAVRMHKLLGCRGVSRSDFIVTPANKAYFLETNTIPGMTSTSLLPHSAQVAGIPFPKLLDMIISSALR